MNKNAKRIRDLRNLAGLTDVEVANQVGIGIEAYCDLEAYDEEIIEQISLNQALLLAEVFQISLLELLEPNSLKRPTLQISPTELGHQLKMNIGNNRDVVENEIGWSLERFLSNPYEEIYQNPISFIQDICGYLEIDWLQCIPRKCC